MRLKDPPLLTGVVAIGALVALAGYLNGKLELVWIFQPLTTLVITWVAWQRGRMANHYAQFVALALGIALAACTWALVSRDPTVMTCLAVLAGLALLSAFTAQTRLSLIRVPLLVALAAAMLALSQLWPMLDSHARLLAASVLIVGALLIGQAGVRLAALKRQARSAGGAVDTAAARRALAGVALLVLAACIAIVDRFIWKAPLAIVWIMSGFWIGLTLLALSVPEQRSHPSRAG